MSNLDQHPREHQDHYVLAVEILKENQWLRVNGLPWQTEIFSSAIHKGMICGCELFYSDFQSLIDACAYGTNDSDSLWKVVPFFDSNYYKLVSFGQQLVAIGYHYYSIYSPLTQDSVTEPIPFGRDENGLITSLTVLSPTELLVARGVPSAYYWQDNSQRCCDMWLECELISATLRGKNT